MSKTKTMTVAQMAEARGEKYDGPQDPGHGAGGDWLWYMKRYNLQTSGKYLLPQGGDRDVLVQEIAQGRWTEWEGFCTGQDLRDIYFTIRGVENPVGRKASPGLDSKAALIDWINAKLDILREQEDFQMYDE
jgi:hypothetical protein